MSYYDQFVQEDDDSSYAEEYEHPQLQEDYYDEHDYGGNGYPPADREASSPTGSVHSVFQALLTNVSNLGSGLLSGLGGPEQGDRDANTESYPSYQPSTPPRVKVTLIQVHAGRVRAGKVHVIEVSLRNSPTPTCARCMPEGMDQPCMFDLPMDKHKHITLHFSVRSEESATDNPSVSSSHPHHRRTGRGGETVLISDTHSVRSYRSHGSSVVSRGVQQLGKGELTIGLKRINSPQMHFHVELLRHNAVSARLEVCVELLGYSPPQKMKVPPPVAVDEYTAPPLPPPPPPPPAAVEVHHQQPHYMVPASDSKTASPVPSLQELGQDQLKQAASKFSTMVGTNTNVPSTPQLKREHDDRAMESESNKWSEVRLPAGNEAACLAIIKDSLVRISLAHGSNPIVSMLYQSVVWSNAGLSGGLIVVILIACYTNWMYPLVCMVLVAAFWCSPVDPASNQRNGGSNPTEPQVREMQRRLAWVADLADSLLLMSDISKRIAAEHKKANTKSGARGATGGGGSNEGGGGGGGGLVPPMLFLVFCGLVVISWILPKWMFNWIMFSFPLLVHYLPPTIVGSTTAPDVVSVEFMKLNIARFQSHVGQIAGLLDQTVIRTASGVTEVVIQHIIAQKIKRAKATAMAQAKKSGKAFDASSIGLPHTTVKGPPPSLPFLASTVLLLAACYRGWLWQLVLLLPLYIHFVYMMGSDITTPKSGVLKKLSSIPYIDNRKRLTALAMWVHHIAGVSDKLALTLARKTKWGVVAFSTSIALLVLSLFFPFWVHSSFIVVVMIGAIAIEQYQPDTFGSLMLDTAVGLGITPLLPTTTATAAYFGGTSSSSRSTAPPQWLLKVKVVEAMKLEKHMKGGGTLTGLDNVSFYGSHMSTISQQHNNGGEDDSHQQHHPIKAFALVNAESQYYWTAVGSHCIAIADKRVSTSTPSRNQQDVFSHHPSWATPHNRMPSFASDDSGFSDFHVHRPFGGGGMNDMSTPEKKHNEGAVSGSSVVESPVAKYLPKWEPPKLDLHQWKSNDNSPQLFVLHSLDSDVRVQVWDFNDSLEEVDCIGQGWFPFSEETKPRHYWLELRPRFGLTNKIVGFAHITYSVERLDPSQRHPFGDAPHSIASGGDNAHWYNFEVRAPTAPPL